MKKLIAAMCTTVLTSIAVAAPTFIGSTINYEYRFPDANTTYPAASNGNHLVGAGVEIPTIINNTGTIDISANSILVSFVPGATFSTNGDFNGFRISDVFNTIDDFASVVIAGASAPEFSISQLSFDADNIYVDLSGWSHSFATSLRFEIGFGAPSPSPNVVSEPSSIALFLAGALAPIFIRRKKRG